MLRIKLIKSPIGQTGHNRKIVAALGLRKLHREKLHDDNPTIRGMIHHVKHMLHVEEVEGEMPAKAPRAPKVAKADRKPKVAKVKAVVAPKAAKPKVEKTKAVAKAEAKPKAVAPAKAEAKPKAEKPAAKAEPKAKKATAKKDKE